ncbi:hypothetical protein BCON_0361g00060 [Botryotinia convoluta]|uniref:BTB domain-containing protein n=1 Tax=Botryotinia convoluta TaxID=54673 RepID=A0A4Z1H9Y2_9HELO|nr:hypothetical protein BCON_0361g00060 [Botryotinia convoluta]
MPASFQDILNSRLFKFIVDEKIDGNAKEFFVHKEAIVQLSKSLYSMMRGGMTESQAGYTIWDDVSKETFELFVQFAYTGDYSVPMPKMKERNRPDKIQSSDKANTVVEYPDTIEACLVPGSALEHPFEGLPDESSRPIIEEHPLKDLLEDLPPPITLEYSPQSNLEDFGSYAKKTSKQVKRQRKKSAPEPEPEEASYALLYIIGDFRFIDSLKALALYKLYKTLCVFQLNNENVKDVVDLARYVYSEEDGEEGFGNEIKELRSLVCYYIAINALLLSLDDGFMDLLGEEGQFVKDFFKFEVQRAS